MAWSKASFANFSGMACEGLFGDGFLYVIGEESGTGIGLCA